MSISKKAINIGAALAMSAAGLVGTASTAVADGHVEAAEAVVHCYGVNKCKGHNDCKAAENACKGHAECKGQGFVAMPAASCDHLGGTTKEGG